MARRSSREGISTKQEKIAALARHEPKMVFTTLAHHVDVEWLREAWRRTRKSGAAGVDGVTAQEYERDLERDLEHLLSRFKTGSYRAPAVRRVHMPKDAAGNSTRPIGIPTLEDKILQRAVLMLLEPVFEQDFYPCSYGFRSGRSAHQGVEALWQVLMGIGGGWVIDLDIQSFFDSVDRTHLRGFLRQRVRDGVVCRTIGKWLNAGVMEKGVVRYPDEGTPQGGVISPLLANLYLHEVLDVWFHEVAQPRLRGRAFMVRYADDATLVFERKEDAHRVLAVLAKRFARYGLRLHPEKTRLVDFRRPGRGPRRDRSETFDLLGFTHYWGKSRRGRWVVHRKTASDRFSRAQQRIGAWCRKNRHLRVKDQHRLLNLKLRGHDSYYGITGNSRALARLRFAVQRIWRKWLSRRSRRARLNWAQFQRLLARYPLTPPRAVHSIYARFAANP